MMMFGSRKGSLLQVFLGVLALLSSMQALSISFAEEIPESPPSTTINADVDTDTDANANVNVNANVNAPTCDAPTCEGETIVVEKDEEESSSFVEAEVKVVSEENKPQEPSKDPPELPSFVETGGILVYFHLYKTGGTSVSELMVELREEEEEYEERVTFINNREEMTVEDIENSVSLAKNDQQAIIYNFHVEYPATMYPTLVEAAPILDSWRTYAEAQGVPFFAATTVREPLGHSLSFFNFFHVWADEEGWSPFSGDMEPTEENFLKTYVPNRLCHLMYNDAHGILEAPDFALKEGLLEELHHFMDEDELDRRNKPSHCDIEKVREILFLGTTFDYVGVIENLSTHTLPMFSKMVFGDAMLAKDAEPRKQAWDVSNRAIPLTKHDLSESTNEKVARESALDQAIYEEARDRFAHWPSYLLRPAASSARTFHETDDDDDYDDEDEDDEDDYDEDDDDDDDDDEDEDDDDDDDVF